MPSITWMPDADRRLATPRGWRDHLSTGLLSAGGRLIRWAWLLAPAPRRPAPELQLEFSPLGGGASDHGALYVNGQLVGTLAGVRRL